ncbi:MAG TPA: hypothetical protein VI728_04455, partial [Syntrophales bacterium]|nr:hypothetical protein [Syntrophales bacterium]
GFASHSTYASLQIVVLLGLFELVFRPLRGAGLFKGLRNILQPFFCLGRIALACFRFGISKLQNMG